MKTTFILILFFFMGGTALMAQEDIIINQGVQPQNYHTRDSGEVFIAVPDGPEFPGGQQAMMEYLKSHISYPQEAVKGKVEGTVYLTFVVEADGRLTHIQVMHGIGHGCDAEAKMVLKTMPRWNPGKQNGNPVRVKQTLPVAFRLKDFQNISKAVNEMAEPPQFPGGDQARRKFITENIRYPEKAKDARKQGTVYAKFIVDSNGKVSDVTILRGVCESIDNEVIRIISSMPDWSPAKDKDGKPMTVWFSLPVKFTLMDEPPIYRGDEATPPEFPGGQKALMEYLRSHVKYPKKAKKKKMEGTVYASFVVYPSGSIGEIQIKRSPDEMFNKTVIKAIKNMPLWKPAEKDGQPVFYRYTLPVKFRL